MERDRKSLELKSSLHEDLKAKAKETGLPMTEVIEILLYEGFGLIDWTNRQSKKELGWINNRNLVKKYQAKYPKADDQLLANYTGLSLRQVEALTYTSHKRALEYMSGTRSKPELIAARANITLPLAKRLWKQSRGLMKIADDEKHLWDLTGPLPIPAVL